MNPANAIHNILDAVTWPLRTISDYVGALGYTIAAIVKVGIAIGILILLFMARSKLWTALRLVYGHCRQSVRTQDAPGSKNSNGVKNNVTSSPKEEEEETEEDEVSNTPYNALSKKEKALASLNDAMLEIIRLEKVHKSHKNEEKPAETEQIKEEGENDARKLRK